MGPLELGAREGGEPHALRRWRSPRLRSVVCACDRRAEAPRQRARAPRLYFNPREGGARCTAVWHPLSEDRKFVKDIPNLASETGALCHIFLEILTFLVFFLRRGLFFG